jgi:hypothetical protein
MQPKITRGMLGGMIGPIVAAAALTPALKAGGVGDGRAGHAGHNHVRDDVHMPQAAADMTDQVLAELKQPAGHAAGIHQVAGKDEKRDRQQGEAGRAGIHPGRHHDQMLRFSEDDEKQGRRQTHRDGDRHANHHQNYQHGEYRKGHHKGVP